MFGEFQSFIGREYELQYFESFSVDPLGRKYSWNDAEEDRRKKIVLVHVDKAQKPATPVQLVRTEEASRMSGETSSRDWNKSSWPQYST